MGGQLNIYVANDTITTVNKSSWNADQLTTRIQILNLSMLYTMLNLGLGLCNMFESSTLRRGGGEKRKTFGNRANTYVHFRFLIYGSPA